MEDYIMNALKSLLLLALCGFAAPVWAIEASPSTLTFNRQTEAFDVRLTDAGEALAAADIKATRFMVGESNYSRMIAVSPIEGGIRVAGTGFLEVGTYLLIIETRRGTTSVSVNVPLKGEMSVLDQRTEALGGAKDEAMQEIGLTTPVSRGSMRFTLPPRYTVGQGLRLAAPGDPGLVYRWLVNGSLEAEGAGALELTYIFPAESDYTVRLEQRSVSGDWKLACESTTMAEQTSAVAMSAKPGQRMTFTAPEGFGKYTWSLDGNPVADGRKAVIAFPTPGSYKVVCRCEERGTDLPGSFYDVRYDVTAK
jgi:hypothetical protein